MEKILILGVGSFAGSSFVDFLLKKKFKITGINRTLKKNEYFLPFKKSANKKNLILHQININKKKDLEKLLNIIKKNKFIFVVDF